MTATAARGVIRRRRITVFGYETRELSTPGSGPTVVLIHGYGDSADTWRPLMERLGREGRRSVAVDLPGFGQASELRRGALLPQWDAFCAALVRRIAERDGADVAVAGNSLGGLLTLRLAQDDTLPISGVIPIAPGGLDRPPWLGLLGDDPIFRRFLSLPIPIPRRVVAAALRQIFVRLVFAQPRSVDPAIVTAFTTHLPTRKAVSGLLAIGRSLVAEVRPGALELDRIHCPVLVVWGSADRMLAPEGAELLAASVPGVTVELLPECGHCPQLEMPDAVGRIILEFSPRRPDGTGGTPAQAGRDQRTTP